MFTLRVVKKNSYNINMDARISNVCGNCGTLHDLQSCAGCMIEHYCSHDCQNEHWASHMNICTKYARIAKGVDTTSIRRAKLWPIHKQQTKGSLKSRGDRVGTPTQQKELIAYANRLEKYNKKIAKHIQSKVDRYYRNINSGLYKNPKESLAAFRALQEYKKDKANLLAKENGNFLRAVLITRNIDATQIALIDQSFVEIHNLAKKLAILTFTPGGNSKEDALRKLTQKQDSISRRLHILFNKYEEYDNDKAGETAAVKLYTMIETLQAEYVLQKSVHGSEATDKKSAPPDCSTCNNEKVDIKECVGKTTVDIYRETLPVNGIFDYLSGGAYFLSLTRVLKNLRDCFNRFSASSNYDKDDIASKDHYFIYRTELKNMVKIERDELWAKNPYRRQRLNGHIAEFFNRVRKGIFWTGKKFEPKSSTNPMVLSLYRTVAAVSLGYVLGASLKPLANFGKTINWLNTKKMKEQATIDALEESGAVRIENRAGELTHMMEEYKKELEPLEKGMGMFGDKDSSSFSIHSMYKNLYGSSTTCMNKSVCKEIFVEGLLENAGPKFKQVLEGPIPFGKDFIAIEKLEVERLSDGSKAVDFTKNPLNASPDLDRPRETIYGLMTLALNTQQTNRNFAAITSGVSSDVNYKLTTTAVVGNRIALEDVGSTKDLSKIALTEEDANDHAAAVLVNRQTTVIRDWKTTVNILKTKQNTHRDRMAEEGFEDLSHNLEKLKFSSYNAFKDTKAYLKTKNSVQVLTDLIKIAKAERTILKDKQVSEEKFRAKLISEAELQKQLLSDRIKGIEDGDVPGNNIDAMTEVVNEFALAVPGLKYVWQFKLKDAVGTFFSITNGPFENIIRTSAEYANTPGFVGKSLWMIGGLATVFASVQRLSSLFVAITLVMSFVMASGAVIPAVLSYILSFEAVQKIIGPEAARKIQEIAEFVGVYGSHANAKANYALRLTMTTILSYFALGSFDNLKKNGSKFNSFIYTIATNAELLFMILSVIVTFISWKWTSNSDAFVYYTKYAVERMNSLGAIPLVAASMWGQNACNWTVGLATTINYIEIGAVVSTVSAVGAAWNWDVGSIATGGINALIGRPHTTGTVVVEVFKNVPIEALIPSFFIYLFAFTRTVIPHKWSRNLAAQFRKRRQELGVVDKIELTTE